MSTEFPYLFSPLKVGPMNMPNRFMMTAHFSAFNIGGIISDRYITYLGERARGGVGCIVTGQQMVHPTSEHKLNESFGFDEKAIPMYSRLADLVHGHGGKLVFQLGHAGRQTDSSLSRLPVLAPSAIPCPATREIPKAMEAEDIAEVVRGFGRVASHARQAGADGVEVHGSSGYLVQEFMSTFSNHRTDEYGESLDNRLRFALEVMGEVRKQAGPGLAVGIRVCGDEFVDGGITLDEMALMASGLASSGNVDYISVSSGNYASLRTAFPLGMGTPLGAFVYLAARIKSVVNVPVVASGRIIDPVQAEQILADGHADIIGMCRSLICDPELPNKARSGRLGDIRSCIGCNQGCLDRSAKAKPITCLHNAAAGHEMEMGPDSLRAAPVRKRVLVAGGGPAGMEAARVAALRGHEVHLYEKGNELGGQINLASRVPSREEFGGVVRFLVGQLDRLKVDVHLGSEVTLELVAQTSPDAVIVATGSYPTGLSVAGGDQENVVSTREVILGAKPVGQKVLMVDDEGHHHGPGVAALLAEQGKQVEVITRLGFLGLDLAAHGETAPIYQKLLSLNVTITPFTTVKRIAGRSVVVASVFTGAESERRDIDTVVVLVGNTADDGLYHSLKGKVKELYRAGDCIAPRKALDAIYDASRIARLV